MERARYIVSENNHSSICFGYFCFVMKINAFKSQRLSRVHQARGQGQGHKQKSEAKAKDSLSEDRHSRGQGQKCSRPRPRTKDTSARRALRKTKKGLHKKFSGDLLKKTFSKKVSGAPQNFNNSKNSAVFEPRTGQFSRT